MSDTPTKADLQRRLDETSAYFSFLMAEYKNNEQQLRDKLHEATATLEAVKEFVSPRSAAVSLVPLRRILGLPDIPEGSLEERMKKICDTSIKPT